MATVPDHHAGLADPRESRSPRASARRGATPIREEIERGEDVDVDGDPMVVETERPPERTRRVIAVWLIASYSILTAIGIAAVAWAKADAQAVALIVTPYGTLVTGVTAYYFFKGRG